MNDDEYAMADPGSEPESDSDFEYEGRGAKRGKGRKSAVKTKPTRSGRSSGRRLEDEMPRTPVTDRSSRASKRGMPPTPGTPQHSMIPSSVMGMPSPHPGPPQHYVPIMPAPPKPPAKTPA